MTVASAFILFFTVFAWSRVVLRYRDQQISWRSLIFWSLVWVSVLLASFYKETASKVSQAIGIGRGVDLTLFLAVLLLLYLVFRLYVKINRLDKDITDLTMKSASLHKNPKGERRGG
jgi:small membrane protein